MRYYAHYARSGLVLVGTLETVPGADRVELTEDQARSLLSGQSSWRDWEVLTVDGKPTLSRLDRELRFLGAALRLSPVLSADDVNKTAHVYLTLRRQPFALVGEREVTKLQAKKLLRQGKVDLWQVKS